MNEEIPRNLPGGVDLLWSVSKARLRVGNTALYEALRPVSTSGIMQDPQKQQTPQAKRK